ncbi:MAG: inorganic phosphate transporter [Halobacteriales archaeon]
MVALEAAATLAVAALASLFMAWAIGAGSSGSTPFAPAVGANAISVMRAGFVVGILILAGAILQGRNVTEAVGRELVGGVTLSTTAATLALTLAALFVAVGIFRGYPIATAFTVTGAVVGVGLAMGGDPAWEKYREIGILWLATPFVGGAAAFATVVALRSRVLPETGVTAALGAVVGAMVVNVEFALLGEDGASIAATAAASVDGYATIVHVAVTAVGAVAVVAWLAREFRHGPDRAHRRFLLWLGALVAFSAGGSQVGLAIGPLLPLVDPLGIPLLAVLVGGAIGLLAGAWMGAPRMIKAISQDYSSLGPRRSIGALIPSFAIAQVAILFGIPISFNEIVISGVVGSGLAAGEVSPRKLGYTALAWLASLAAALGLGYVGFAAIAAIS